MPLAGHAVKKLRLNYPLWPGEINRKLSYLSNSTILVGYVCCVNNDKNARCNSGRFFVGKENSQISHKNEK